MVSLIFIAMWPSTCSEVDVSVVPVICGLDYLLIRFVFSWLEGQCYKLT